MEQVIVTSNDALKVANRLNRYAHRGQETTPVMWQIAADMIAVEGAVFASNGRRGGGSWKRLKPDTVRKKGVFDILRTRDANLAYSEPGNDALFDSLTKINAPFQILEVSRRGVEFGTSVPAAGIMQEGSSKRNIPARPFMRFTQNDVDRWNEMIIAHLMRD